MSARKRRREPFSADSVDAGGTVVAVLRDWNLVAEDTGAIVAHRMPGFGRSVTTPASSASFISAGTCGSAEVLAYFASDTPDTVNVAKIGEASIICQLAVPENPSTGLPRGLVDVAFGQDAVALLLDNGDVVSHSGVICMGADCIEYIHDQLYAAGGFGLVAVEPLAFTVSAEPIKATFLTATASGLLIGQPQDVAFVGMSVQEGRAVFPIHGARAAVETDSALWVTHGRNGITAFNFDGEVLWSHELSERSDACAIAPLLAAMGDGVKGCAGLGCREVTVVSSR